MRKSLGEKVSLPTCSSEQGGLACRMYCDGCRLYRKPAMRKLKVGAVAKLEHGTVRGGTVAHPVPVVAQATAAATVAGATPRSVLMAWKSPSGREIPVVPAGAHEECEVSYYCMHASTTATSCHAGVSWPATSQVQGRQAEPVSINAVQPLACGKALFGEHDGLTKAEEGVASTKSRATDQPRDTIALAL
jgi:hypothetical protein